MTSYYSTFITGLGAPVTAALRKRLPDVRIVQELDGLLVYETNRPLQQVRGLRFFHNSFLLIHLFTRIRPDATASMLAQLLRQPDLVRIPAWAGQGMRSFRLIASRENQTVPIPRDLLEKAERFFSHRLRMGVQRSKPDTEVWMLERSEGVGLAGLRLTKGGEGELPAQRGELRSDLVHVLGLLAETGKDDICLDPFAGSGAIPLEVGRHLPCRRVIAGEQDGKKLPALKKRLGGLGARAEVLVMDARTMSAIPTGEIDRIITDPPWGLFEAREAGELEDFYRAVLAEMRRVLKKDGRAVVLMGQKEVFERALGGGEFAVEARLDILVSGKKAGVYVLRPRAG